MEKKQYCSPLATTTLFGSLDIILASGDTEKLEGFYEGWLN